MLNLGKTISGAAAKAQASVRDHAKQVVKEQSTELVKSFKQQGEIIATGQAQSQKPPELLPQINEVSPEEKQKIEADSQSMMAKLEAELAQLRTERQQVYQQWVKQQNEKMHPEQVEGKEPPRREIIIPTSKPTGPNAAQAAVKAKQGSRETTKQRST